MAQTYTQTRFRFRKDDGNETGATWIDGENTNITFAGGTNFRLRIQLDETSNTSGTATNCSLQYSLNGGAYANIRTNIRYSTDKITASLSSYYAENDTTTRQLSVATGTFDGTNGMKENNAASIPLNFTANYYREYEICLIINPALVSTGDTFDFKLIHAQINQYDYIPRLTVGSGAVTTKPQYYYAQQ